MNILFFDILISGHHSEYIEHVLMYLKCNNKNNNNYYFVVHQDFSESYPNIWKTASAINNIYFIEVDKSLLIGLAVKNRFSRSLNNFKVVDFYAKKFSINVCYLLYFNTFQIALGLKKTKYKIRGILFMQFTNMTKITLKQKYYYYRRYFPLSLCLKNKFLDKIFILNDEKSCSVLNYRFKKNNLFSYLPDPIPNLVPQANFNIYREYKIENNRKIFLLFGALSERKGIIETLLSVNFLNQENQEKVAIIIAGKTKDLNLSNYIKGFIKENKNKTKVQITWDNNFIENSKMASLFQQTDFVLMPYKNPEASSGILGHAMKARKPVIGPYKGLIGSIISEYKTGLLIKDITPKEIANAISNHNNIEEIDENNLNHFLETHTVTNFAKTLLCN
ncbi:glycosyltransferase [uncultured Polaribacter sp.]|uniref:glycosyltransferase n=1 Tax=uncultured Polaribacter sp. TaxID=174711 RepID=UPI00261B92AB|nr:glycosyltransferase [uncultured Polaribacter sp.]